MKLSLRSKALLAPFFANSQTLRWMTQGIFLRRFWKGKIASGMECLDVGCGGGSYAIWNFLEKGARATLTEYEKDRLQLAREQVAQSGWSHNADFQQADAQALPFGEGVFDRLQMLEVLEHLPQPDLALRELHRVSKPGAWLVLSTPHPPEWFPNADHLVEGYQQRELEKLLRENGWEMTDHAHCMILPARFVFYILCSIKKAFPFPTFLLAIESLMPDGWRKRLLPYDLIAIARRREGVSWAKRRD